MDRYSKYYGVITFFIILLVALFLGFRILEPAITGLMSARNKVEQIEKDYQSKLKQKQNVERRLTQIKSSIANAQKKIYSPVDTDLGNDTLFFTLYNDIIEMLHANSIKIKSIDYRYNPDSDAFVQFGKDVYFVCEVDMNLISNYTNLGKFIQDILQYPYYIKIDNIDVNPYQKDKKILLSNVKLRLYAHTTPAEPES